MAILGRNDVNNSDSNAILDDRAFAVQATASENGRVSTMTFVFDWSVSLIQSMFFKPLIWDSSKNVLYNGGETEFVTPTDDGVNYALTLNPMHANAALNLGLCLNRLKEAGKAERAFRRFYVWRGRREVPVQAFRQHCTAENQYRLYKACYC